MLNRTDRFEYQSRTVFILAALMTVIVVGLVDYATGWKISFSVFYLLAVGLATWFVGTRFAFFIALLSVAVSLGGDLAAGERYSDSLVPWWNAFVILLFYVVFILVFSKLRDLYSEMEMRVRQRTASLTNEMEKREWLEKELLEISEHEQRRIGHDLHDSLGQHFTGTALAAQVLNEKLAARGLPEAADANKVVELIGEGIEISRKIAKGLHSFEMETDGLMTTLEELSVTSSELFNITCRFDCDAPLLIHDVSISDHLYRIAQEAVSNAVKHGKARNVVIQLETMGEGIALHIIDDGVGLPESIPKHSGMGMRIMEHRASIIGATLTACRGEHGGTTVSCIMSPKGSLEKSQNGSQDN